MSETTEQGGSRNMVYDTSKLMNRWRKNTKEKEKEEKDKM